MEYVNGTTQTYTYDSGKLYRLTRKTTTSSASPNALQDLSYIYDPVGNITNITDTGTELPKTSNFQYDELDRLTNAAITDTNTGQTTTEAYTYSPNGNILSKVVNGVTTEYRYEDKRHPHAVTRQTFASQSSGGQATPKGGQADTYAYDANGNMVSETRNLPDGSHGGEAISYKYDPFNRLATITNSAGSTSYSYSDSTKRVSKVLPNGRSATVYIGELAEANEMNDFTTHLFADTLRVATSDKTGTYYNAGDHLGSASLALDAAGAVVQKLDYLPFGGERVNVKTAAFDAHFTYTDQERDDESGLMYYGARYYHPVLGRFTQPDPVIIDTGRREFQIALYNPQLMNAYSYVGNNPLKLVDDNGEIPRIAQDMQQGFGFWLGGQGFSSVAQGAYTVRGFLNNAAQNGYEQGGSLRSGAAFLTEGLASTFGNAGKVVDPTIESNRERAFAVVMLSVDLASEGRGKTAEQALKMVKVSDKANEAKIVVKTIVQKVDPLAKKASDVINNELKGSVNRVFPSELRNKTLREIKQLTREGGELVKKAQKAWKLLTSGEYKK